MSAKLIDRTGAEVLIPEERSREILAAVPEQSIAMRLMRRLPDMTSKTRSIPVASSLPTAEFINGDTGLKPTTDMAWENVKLTAEEIAAIVVIPENVLDDSDYDIWANVLPRINEAIGVAFDKAVLFGTDKPASFPSGIVNGAADAGNALALDGGASLYQQLLGEGGLAALVEEDGFVPSAYVGAVSMRSKLRGTVDGNGLPIFGRAPYREGMFGRAAYELDGADIYFPGSGVMDAQRALLIGGDWSQAVWAMRTDITTKLLTEAVISDATGKVLINLAQQDAVALRVVFRAGWALANPINRVNESKASRYPFAVLTPAE
ncbi:MAG: phage major capsid protein [Clostridia bacterium]|nr:phage major capsid protein [Clostridia bacterium]